MYLLEAISRVTDTKRRTDEVQAAISKKQGRLKALSEHQRRRLAFNPSRFMSKFEATITYEADYAFTLILCALYCEPFLEKDVRMASYECLYHLWCTLTQTWMSKTCTTPHCNKESTENWKRSMDLIFKEGKP